MCSHYYYNRPNKYYKIFMEYSILKQEVFTMTQAVSKLLLQYGKRWLYVPYYQKHWPINGIQTAGTQIRIVTCHVDLHTPRRSASCVSALWETTPHSTRLVCCRTDCYVSWLSCWDTVSVDVTARLSHAHSSSSSSTTSS